MNAVSHLKLGLATAGVILFGYGVRVESNWMRWTGIGFLAAAAIMRFWRRKAPPRDEHDGPSGRSRL